MPGQPGRKQASFASGELEDMLEERRDLKMYASGLAYAANLTPLPQGPARLRDYTRRVSPIRHLLNQVSLAAATMTAPAGGTAGDAVDGDASTVMVTDNFSMTEVIYTVTFPAPVAIAAVDLVNMSATAAGTIQVEYNAGAGWQVLNGPRLLRLAGRSRRFAAPPDDMVTAAAWRVQATIPTDGTVSLGEIRFFAESMSYGVNRLRAFSFSADADYELVLTPGNGDVFKVSGNGGWVTAFDLPVTGDQLAVSRWLQQLNTALLFRRAGRTVRIFRENSDIDWNVDYAPYSNLPQHDFGDTDYGNGLPAIWDLQFVGTDASTRFTLTVEGEETEAISADGDHAAAVGPAVNRLPSVSPGVDYANPTGDICRVTFTGDGNEGNVRINAARVINKADAAVAWLQVQKGTPGGEPVYSDARGWPGAGAFYQQRLVMGGSSALGNVFLASITGEYFDMNTEVSAANGGMLIPMDTKGAETIEEMLVTRALLIFTSSGEYWVANAALSKAQAPNPVRGSNYGIAPGVPVVENEGGHYFITRSGNTLGCFTFNEIDQVYGTTRESLRASHLVKGVTDMTIRRATDQVDCNVIFYCQADGAARMVALLKEQETIGFSRIETDGKVLALSCGEANVVSQIAERTVDGSPYRFLERYEPGLLLDQAVTYTFEPPVTLVNGLGSDFEGAQVWAIADGEAYGPSQVVNGAITLPVAASVVTVGRWKPFVAEILPPPRVVAGQIVTESDVGYHTVRASVKDTTSLAIGANGQPVEDVPTLRFGAPSDVPSTLAPFTGNAVRDGIPGSEDNPTIVITQLRPGHLTLRSVTGEGDL